MIKKNGYMTQDIAEILPISCKCCKAFENTWIHELLCLVTSQFNGRHLIEHISIRDSLLKQNHFINERSQVMKMYCLQQCGAKGDDVLVGLVGHCVL